NDQTAARNGRKTSRSMTSKPLNSLTEDTNVSISQALALLSVGPGLTKDVKIADASLSVSMFQTLIHHFCTKAVSRLTWIDQPSHPWRTIVQNSLQYSACVQLSISSLAAAHLSMTPGMSLEQSYSLFGIYCSLRDRCLRGLSAKMDSELRSGKSTVAESTDTIPAIEILASMLALCYTEVFVPGSHNWKIHLRACRKIINIYQLDSHQSASTDSVLKFLLKDINDMEILTGTTAFDNDILSFPSTSLQYSNMVSGWAFTSLIHKITTLERKRHLTKLADGALCSVNMSVWHRHAEEAHRRTMACPRLRSASQSQALRECFHALTRVYYYATLIYSYQAFATAGEKSSSLSTLIDGLLKDVKYTISGSTHDLSHDLFFPLFIAGVETTFNREQQIFVEKLFVESLSKTGIWCNYPALQYLRALWSNPEHLLRHDSWIDHARATVSTTGSFVVF
ncbi:hypothetical protein E4U16_003104, partial [Claviceps sp. LM84 group G4]